MLGSLRRKAVTAIGSDRPVELGHGKEALPEQQTLLERQTPLSVPQFDANLLLPTRPAAEADRPIVGSCSSLDGSPSRELAPVESGAPHRHQSQLVLRTDSNEELVVEKTLRSQMATETRPSHLSTMRMEDRETLPTSESLEQYMPTERGAEEESSTCTPYGERDEKWITEGRGGNLPCGYTGDQTGYSAYFRLGAQGRPLGVATQVDEPPPVVRRLPFTEPHEQTTTSPSRTKQPTELLTHPGTPPEHGSDDLMISLVNRLSEEQAKMQADLNFMKATVSKQQAALRTLERDLGRTQAAFSNEQMARREAEANCSQMKATLQQLTVELHSGKAQASQSEERARFYQAENERQAAHFQQLEARYYRLEQIVSQQGEKCCKDLRSFHDHMQALREQYDRLEERISEARENEVQDLQKLQDALTRMTIPSSTPVPLATSTPREEAAMETPTAPPNTASTQESSSSVLPSSTVSEGWSDESGRWSTRATEGSSSIATSPELISSFSQGDQPREDPQRRVRWDDEFSHSEYIRHEQPANASLRRMGKPNRDIADLPKFFGKPGEPLHPFFRKIENAAKMGNWDSEFMRGRVYHQLQGAAVQYIDALPSRATSTYEQLRNTLTTKYAGELAKDNAKEQLRAIRRGRNETPDGLALRIQELVRMVYPESMWDQEGITAFKTAISDSTLVEYLVLNRPKTLEECANALTRIENHRESEARRKQPMRRLCEVVAPPVPAQSQAPKGGSPKQQRQLQATAAAINSTPSTETKPLTVQDVQKVVERILEMKERPERPRQEQKTPRGGQKGTGSSRHEWPSEEQPCRVCGSPEHWEWRCPKRNQQNPGNDKGLDPGSRAQSGSK